MNVLIAPKPFKEYTEVEFHAYVQSMYELRTKGPAKLKSPAPGLKISRTKKGVLTVKRTKVRPFAYVTRVELAALAKEAGTNQSDLWNMFKQKKYLITKDRMEAERIHADIKGLPW